MDFFPVFIALSSGGAAPVLARLLRERVETLVPAAYGRLASLASSFRNVVKQRLGSFEARRRFWERVNLAERPASGEVYLIGGGPGDPELLTLRALRLLQQAEVVVYDHLLSDAVLELARRDAQRIYVGKESGHHTLPQPEVNALLIALARQGKRVARLKGGDPYVFGRGGEEAEALAAHDIPFQVVPGITAACGVAAATGVPLTHRDYAQSCVLVAGHLKDGGIDLDWDALARPHQTIAIYMGLKGLPILCRELIAHGLPAATPAMVVQKGTTREQRAVVGTLESLPRAAAAAGLTPPTLIIVGEVVKLRGRLGAFDAFPDRSAADIDPFTTARRA